MYGANGTEYRNAVALKWCLEQNRTHRPSQDLFYGPHTNYAIIDNWRFWIIHLWVEGFFELFATVLVAVMFVQMGLVSVKSATRLIYLDAILFLTGGIVGTGHHWYFTGQSTLNMGLASCFSALEVVPLTLLTLDAWDFIRLKDRTRSDHGRSLVAGQIWAIRFLIAVGVWNFIGAGVFGFLINLPIVSYFEMGTTLTANHGHAAMFGVFGMLALGVLVFCLRALSSDEAWSRAEKHIRRGFWGLNIGLTLMVLLDLFPAGVLQLWDVLTNGYWHARHIEYLLGGTYPYFSEGPVLRSNYPELPLDSMASVVNRGVFAPPQKTHLMRFDLGLELLCQKQVGQSTRLLVAFFVFARLPLAGRCGTGYLKNQSNDAKRSLLLVDNLVAFIVNYVVELDVAPLDRESADRLAQVPALGRPSGRMPKS